MTSHPRVGSPVDGLAFHPGELRAQRFARTGEMAERVRRAMVSPAIPAEAFDLLAWQRLLVLGGPDARGRLWATALVGPEGFLHAPDGNTLHVSAHVPSVDPLAEALRGEVEVGTLVIDLVDRIRLRINGRWRPTGRGGGIEVHQSFGNGPKYVQARAGFVGDLQDPAPVAVSAPSLSARQQDLVAAADTFFVATAAAGGADVSHRGGNPGFVSATSPTELSWPDYVGNAMMMTAGNLELDPRAGLLFPDWATGAALHLTGRARVEWSAVDPGTAPANGHRTVFHIDEAVWIEGGFPAGWAPPQRSRHNP